MKTCQVQYFREYLITLEGMLPIACENAAQKDVGALTVSDEIRRFSLCEKCFEALAAAPKKIDFLFEEETLL